MNVSWKMCAVDMDSEVYRSGMRFFVSPCEMVIAVRETPAGIEVEQFYVRGQCSAIMEMTTTVLRRALLGQEMGNRCGELSVALRLPDGREVRGRFSFGDAVPLTVANVRDAIRETTDIIVRKLEGKGAAGPAGRETDVRED